MAPAKVDWGSSLENMRPVCRSENGELGFCRWRGREGEEEKEEGEEKEWMRRIWKRMRKK